MQIDYSQLDFSWLVFGLITQDKYTSHNDLTCRIPGKCTIVYSRQGTFCAMRYGCPYWIRLEGHGWGMMVSMQSNGTFCRAIRGNREAAERDLFLLRMYLPKPD
jgi:hypothetical protein